MFKILVVEDTLVIREELTDVLTLEDTNFLRHTKIKPGLMQR
jgi:CheY-like chemotaxis protein